MNEEEQFLKKKSLGQHFLTSDTVPKWMCDAANIKRGETILEIGPGTGILTKELLLRGAVVTALEADLRAVEILQETFAKEIKTGQLVVHHTDVRTFDIDTYNLKDHMFKVVSNIPYYLSGMLFRTFLQNDIQPSHLVFLVQKEVAERIASTKKESLLSLSVKAFGEPSYVRTVTKGHFTPPPKIDSAIISIENITQNAFTTVTQAFFFDVLHIGFGQKRKQLLGNLAHRYPRETLTNIFSTLSIPLNIRAENLSLQQWLILVEKLHKMSTP